MDGRERWWETKMGLRTQAYPLNSTERLEAFLSLALLLMLQAPWSGDPGD